MISLIKQIVALIAIITLCVLSNSCKRNNELLGTWVLAYDFGTNDSIPVYNSNRTYNQFLTFEKENYSLLVIGPLGHLDILKGEYDLKNDKLKFLENSETESNSFGLINYKSQDSIIISNSYGINKKGYVRLPDSFKNNSNNSLKLSGKSFLRKHQKLNDTITFINDSLYKSLSFKVESLNENLYWKRLFYYGFDLLYLEYFSPYVIKRNDDVINLRDIINNQEIILEPIVGNVLKEEW